MSDWRMFVAVMRQNPDLWMVHRDGMWTADTRRADGWIDRETGEWRPHREMDDGDWAVAYLCFRVSGKPNIATWRRQSEPAMWEDLGFPPRTERGDCTPKYDTVRRHFITLETRCLPAFEAVLRSVFARIPPEVNFARYIVGDATEEDSVAVRHPRLRPGRVLAGTRGRGAGQVRAGAEAARPVGGRGGRGARPQPAGGQGPPGGASRAWRRASPRRRRGRGSDLRVA